MIYLKDTKSLNSKEEKTCTISIIWLRSLQKVEEACEDELYTFPKARLEITRKQSGHDTGFKTSNKKLVDYKSRKQ